jgi:hypothetical protein
MLIQPDDIAGLRPLHERFDGGLGSELRPDRAGNRMRQDRRDRRWLASLG